MKQKHAYVLGAYGTGNMGDDLLFEAAARRLKERGYTAVCVGYGAPEIKDQVEYMTLVEFNQLLLKYDGINSSGAGAPLAALGGGGLFWSSESAAMFTSLLTQAKLKGLRVEIHAIGLSGAAEDPIKRHMIQVLSKVADYFSVRETESQRAVQLSTDNTAAVIMEPDLVAQTDRAILFKNCQPAKVNPLPVVGLNVTMINTFQLREHLGLSIGNAIKQLAGKVHFRYLPQVRHRLSVDEQCMVFAEWLRLYSGGLLEVPIFPETTDDFLAQITEVDMVLAARLHTVICSQSYGLPTTVLILNKEDKKYTEFAQEQGLPMVNLYGHNWEVTENIVEAVTKTLLIKAAA